MKKIRDVLGVALLTLGGGVASGLSERAIEKNRTLSTEEWALALTLMAIGSALVLWRSLLVRLRCRCVRWSRSLGSRPPGDIEISNSN
jgi:hypothetical protein